MPIKSVSHPIALVLVAMGFGALYFYVLTAWIGACSGKSLP